MLCNLPVLLVHLDVFMLILSIVVSLVHDHISSGIVKGGGVVPQLCSRPFQKSKSVKKLGGRPPRMPLPLATCPPPQNNDPGYTTAHQLCCKFTIVFKYMLYYYILLLLIAPSKLLWKL